MKEGFLKTILKFYVPSIVSFALGLLSAVVLTRVFTPTVYGNLNVFNNTVSLILSISYLGFDSAYIRFYNEPPKGYDKTQLCYSLLKISVEILSTAGFIIVVFFSDIFTDRIFGFKSSIVCLSLFLNVMAQLIVRYFTISYRMEMNTRNYSIVTILMQVTSKFCVLFSALFTSDVVIILTVNSVGVIVMAIVLLVGFSSVLIPKQRPKVFFKEKEIIKFAIFSAPISIIISINSFTAQQIIKTKFGMESVGIYSAANYFSSIFAVLQSGFATFWAAYIYGNYKTEQETIKKMHDMVMLVLIYIYAAFILFKDIVYFLIGNEYHDSKSFFAMVVFYPIMILLASTTDCGIGIKKKNYISLVIYFLVVVCNISLAFILSDWIGLKGIACASAFSGLMYYIISTYFGQRYYITIINRKKSFIGLGIFVIMMLASGILEGICLNLIEIVMVIIASLIYLKELIYIGTKIKSFFKKWI